MMRIIAILVSTWIGTAFADLPQNIPTPPVPEAGTMGAVAFVGLLAGAAIIRRRKQQG